MHGTTKKQEKIIRFIAKYTEEHGFSPTFIEIAQHIGANSTNAAADHIKRLRQKGFIEPRMAKQTARSIRLCERPPIEPNDPSSIEKEIYIIKNQIRNLQNRLSYLLRKHAKKSANVNTEQTTSD